MVQLSKSSVCLNKNWLSLNFVCFSDHMKFHVKLQSCCTYMDTLPLREDIFSHSLTFLHGNVCSSNEISACSQNAAIWI